MSVAHHLRVQEYKPGCIILDIILLWFQCGDRFWLAAVPDPSPHSCVPLRLIISLYYAASSGSAVKSTKSRSFIIRFSLTGNLDYAMCGIAAGKWQCLATLPKAIIVQKYWPCSRFTVPVPLAVWEWVKVALGRRGQLGAWLPHWLKNLVMMNSINRSKKEAVGHYTWKQCFSKLGNGAILCTNNSHLLVNLLRWGFLQIAFTHQKTIVMNRGHTCTNMKL